jgi:PAS domain S-box-containing protein
MSQNKPFNDLEILNARTRDWWLVVWGAIILGLMVILVVLGSALVSQERTLFANLGATGKFLLTGMRVTVILLSVALMGITTRIIRLNRRDRKTGNWFYELTRQRERQAIRLWVAAEVARDASGTLELHAVLSRAANLVSARFDFYHVGVFLLDETGTFAVLRAAAGAEPSRILLESDHRLKVGSNSIVGYVTSVGKPRIAQNVAHDSVHWKNPQLPATQSELAVPFKVSGHIIGALDVQSTQSNAFDEDSVVVLQALADLLAIAIDKAQLHEQIQAHASHLEQRVAERTTALAHEQAQLRAILDSMGEGLIYDDKTGNRYVNRMLAQMTGFAAEEWQQPANPDTSTALGQLINYPLDADIWRGELQVTRKDGSLFDAGVTCARVTEEGGEPIGQVMVIRDISARKMLDQQKARFVADASHELRTPITNFKTYLYLARRQPDKYEKHLSTLDHLAERMRRLVEQLLDMSRFERGVISLQQEKIHLQELVAEVVRVQMPEAQLKGVGLASKLASEPLFVSVDVDRMTQVITNLVTNAINYTPDGGQVTVWVKPYASPTDNCNSRQWAVITVEDTGIGIVPEHLEQIFQPFFRSDESKVKGTGLGLSIARRIVELHGGELTAESEVGHGSRFLVRLECSGNSHLTSSSS